MIKKNDNIKKLNALQTRLLLQKMNGPHSKLDELESLSLDQRECCRVLLVNFARCWAVAEAARLEDIVELSELCIIELSAHLGFSIDDLRGISQKRTSEFSSSRSAFAG